jgi:hypothetical protein
MNIEWDRVTWYSKFAAVIFFILILPIWTFYIGRQYQATINYLEMTDSGSYSLTIGTSTKHSGIKAVRGEENSKAKNHFVIEDSRGNVVTETVANPRGSFMVFLNPGNYTIRNAAATRLSKPNVNVIESEITIVNLD